jgi:rhodanese-related sulfurtransferase
MKKQYLLGIVAFIVLALIVAVSGVNHRDYVEKNPDHLFLDLIESTRYFTVEEVAQMIISQDPSIQLIDLRDSVYYNKFSLNGAINIPLSKLFSPENKVYIDQDVYKTIFFSNGSSDADIAWMLSTRMGYKNVFVMQGGLNTWVDHILQPSDNSVIWDKVNDQLYQYRKGASIYFGGKSINEDEGSTAPKSKKPIMQGKKKEVSGGCS